MRDRTAELIERLANLMATELRLAAAGHGLLAVHAHVLHYLARCNRYSNTAGALASYLGLTKGTISQSLSVLERRGLIVRRDDPADRRVVRLELTPEGSETAAVLFPPAPWRLLDDEPEAADALEELLRTLQRHHGGRSFGVCSSCRHFLREPAGGFRCALTREPLDARDAAMICREHEFEPAQAV